MIKYYKQFKKERDHYKDGFTINNLNNLSIDSVSPESQKENNNKVILTASWSHTSRVLTLKVCQ